MAEIREKLILTADNSDLVKGTKEAAASVEEIGQAGQEAGADLGTAMEETHAVLQKVGDEAHEVKSAFSEVATETARMPATVGKDVKEVEAAVAKLGTGVRTTGGEFALAAAAAKKLPDEAMRGAREAQSAVDALGKEAKETGAELGKAATEAKQLPSSLDGLKDKASNLDSIGRKLNELALAAKAFVANLAAEAIGRTIGAVSEMMEKIISRGVEYNRTLQDSQSSLAALIMANYDLADSHGKVLEGQEKVSASFKAARELQQGLEKDAAKTSATYQELVNAFTAGMAPATELGITNMTRLREIMLAASQAAKTLGVEGHGLAQEMRALFQFESGPDNRLANSLSLSKDKLKELRAAGVDVSKWLLEQLKPYSEAAAGSVHNLSVTMSNLSDAIDKAAGKLTQPLFEEMAKSAESLTKKLPELTRGLDDIGKNMAEGAKGTEQLAAAFIKLGVHAATLGSEGSSSIAKFATALANAIDKLVEIDKRMEDATWIATGKSRMELLMPIIERLIGQITGLPVAFGKADEASAKSTETTKKQTEAVKDNTAAEEARLEAKKKATEEEKKLAEERAKAAEAEKKARDAMDADAKGLAELADKVQMGRASYADLRAEMDKLAEKHKTTREAIAALVEQKRLELEQAKESKPVYENVAEAAQQEAKAREEQARAIDEVTEARRREREAAGGGDPVDVTVEDRTPVGGGPMAWIRDIDTSPLDDVQQRVDAIATSIERMGQGWVTAREYVTAYLGEARKASEESQRLAGYQVDLLDNLSKFAEQNKQTTEWFQTFVKELEDAMKNTGDSYEEQTRVLDAFLKKLGDTTNWMQMMNAEFVLGGSFYGDVSRQFGEMAAMIQRFKDALGSPTGPGGTPRGK